MSLGQSPLLIVHDRLRKRRVGRKLGQAFSLLWPGEVGFLMRHFFEASKDVTTGEGRIIAAVLFVGGLLLWFLGSNKRR